MWCGNKLRLRWLRFGTYENEKAKDKFLDKTCWLWEVRTLAGSKTRNKNENSWGYMNDVQYNIHIIWPILSTMHILEPCAKGSQFILYVVFLFACTFHCMHFLYHSSHQLLNLFIYTLPPLHHVCHSTLPELFILMVIHLATMAHVQPAGSKTRNLSV